MAGQTKVSPALAEVAENLSEARPMELESCFAALSRVRLRQLPAIVIQPRPA